MAASTKHPSKWSSTTKYIRKYNHIATIHIPTNSCVRPMEAFQFTFIEKIPTGVGLGHGALESFEFFNKIHYHLTLIRIQKQ